MKILNLTQHKATPEQAAAGVVDMIIPPDKERLAACLTFDQIPDSLDMAERAITLCKMAQEYSADAVMLGGAPYFMPVLSAAMKQHGFRVFFAFSVRNVVEDGDTKTSVFKHAGFVEL